MMESRDRARLLLYDKGKWIGGRVLSKTSNWGEGEEYLQANSNSSSNIVIETDFVYKSTDPAFVASERLIYTNAAGSSYSAQIQVGYMNDSNVFQYIKATQGNAANSVKQSDAKQAIDENGYYILSKAITHTSQAGKAEAIGRKVCIRLTTYFGAWRIDKVWLSGISRL